MDREGFEPSISPMPRAYPTSLDDRPNLSDKKNLTAFDFYDWLLTFSCVMKLFGEKLTEDI